MKKKENHSVTVFLRKSENSKINDKIRYATGKDEVLSAQIQILLSFTSSTTKRSKHSLSTLLMFLFSCLLLILPKLIQSFHFRTCFNQLNGGRAVLRMSTLSAAELVTYGDDIAITQPDADVKKIVMKFGGSSLANPERITYVSK